MVENPKTWTMTFIANTDAFKIWEANARAEVAGQVAQTVATECQSAQKDCAATGSCQACDGCAITISRIYKEFETYLNRLFSETFKTYRVDMFDKLNRANLALETPQ